MELGLLEEKLIVGRVQEKYKMSLLYPKARTCSRNDVTLSEGTHGSQLEGGPTSQMWGKPSIKINNSNIE